MTVVTARHLIDMIYAVQACECTHEQDHHCYHYAPGDGDARDDYSPMECCHCGLRRPFLGEVDPDMSVADLQRYFAQDDTP